MQIFCDFDGTITNRDSIVFLTETFGAGEQFRLDILEAIKRGDITVFEAIERELETVKATWAEAVSALDESVWIDPDFPAFVTWCSERNFPLSIVSSGMAPVVEHYVGRFGVPVFAHPVTVDPAGWRYRRDERNDKKHLLAAASREKPLVFIGDGTSDVSAVPFADILFARAGFFLSEHCSQRGIAHYTFTSFREIRKQLDALLSVEA